MNLSEDEIMQKYAKQCLQCSQNTLLPYEYDLTCIACGYNLIKRRQELSKIQRKKLKFVNSLKYAEQKKLRLYRSISNI